jgi:hypothetical protein
MPFSATLLALPNWLLIVLITLVTAVLPVCVLRIVWRYVPPSVMKVHNDVAGFMFATIGVVYAVLLAFVVLVVWEEFNEAHDDVAVEGAEAVTLQRHLLVYPDEGRAVRLHAGYRKYVELVVRCEYPAQRRLEDCPSSRAALIEFWKETASIEPKSTREQMALDKLLSQLGELQKYRVMRQAATAQSVPTPVWAAVITGGVLTMGFTFLFGSENRWAQTIMTACLGAMVGITISVILILQYPFSGGVRLTAEGYEHVLELYENRGVASP